MASVINTISSNVPAKARVMIILSVVVVLGIVIFSFASLMGGSNEVSKGLAKIDLPPTEQEISKDSLLKETLYDENSEVGKVYAADEQKQQEQARINGNRSHLDAIRISLEQDKKPEPVKPKEEKPQSELQALLRSREQEKEKRQNQQQVQVAQQQAGVGMQPNPWQQFIDDERKFARDYAVIYGQGIDELRQKSKETAKPVYYASGENDSSSSQSGGIPSNGQQVGNMPQQGSTGYQLLMAKENNRTNLQQSQQGQQGQQGQAGSAEPEFEGEQPEKVYDYPSERLAAANSKMTPTSGTIQVGDVYYGTLQIAVNSDEISPIRAVVVQPGKLQNAVLVGKPARIGEKVTLTFERMNINGKGYKVEVVALDPDTLRTGLADGVDRHTFERYSKLFLASFTEGIAKGMTGGQTVTNTDGSSSRVIDALPDPMDQALVGLGTVGERFVPIFEKAFDRPPTVTVEANKMIELMFMEEVVLK